MGLSIQDIVDGQLLKEARIIAGLSGKSNEVTWVNVMEILDAPNSIQPGELLVTTGYRLDKRELYADLIETLKKRGVSGIAIQTGYYIDRIPQYIIHDADVFGFPVLNFSKDLTFSEILHTLIHKINIGKLKHPESDRATKYMYDYFKDMVMENLTNLFPEQPHETALFIIQPNNYYAADKKIIEDCYQKIKSLISAQSDICYGTILNTSTFAFLIRFIGDEQYQEFVYELSIHLTYLSEQQGVSFYAGADKLVALEYLSLSFQRATKCIQLLKSIHARRGVCSYDNMTFLKMFGILHQNESSIVLDNQALQILLNYDRINQTNYVHTLRIYLAYNCNTTKTSKQLFIHRHTLLIRLKKITDLCGINLNNYYARMYMSTALIFHDYFAF